MKHVLDQTSIPETPRTCSGWSTAALRPRNPTVATAHAGVFLCFMNLCSWSKLPAHQVSFSRWKQPGSKPALGSAPLKCCPSHWVLHLPHCSQCSQERAGHISLSAFPKGSVTEIHHAVLANKQLLIPQDLCLQKVTWHGCNFRGIFQ